MNDGKWIHGLTAETPLADAAQRVLHGRFEVVRHHLPLVLLEASKDVENVHQLRVATRRARAALDIFDTCLAASAYKSAKKQLRRIRRAAGQARDWDVFLAALTARPPGSPRQLAGRDLLLGYALDQRRLAQVELQALDDDYPERFHELETEVLEAIEAPARQTLLELAQPLLAKLIQELDQALAGDLEDYAHLHQVRIIGKRLRYAMEVFADCFPPAFRDELYPVVEEMQEILGLANDSHVASARLEEMGAMTRALPPRVVKRVYPGVAGLRLFHEQRLVKQRHKFLGWRRDWLRDGRSAFAACGLELFHNVG